MVATLSRPAMLAVLILTLAPFSAQPAAASALGCATLTSSTIHAQPPIIIAAAQPVGPAPCALGVWAGANTNSCPTAMPYWGPAYNVMCGPSVSSGTPVICTAADVPGSAVVVDHVFLGFDLYPYDGIISPAEPTYYGNAFLHVADVQADSPGMGGTTAPWPAGMEPHPIAWVVSAAPGPIYIWCF
jgi:hypothetical protein